MNYILFTFPNCGKCQELKKYLKDKGIQYKEINAGIEEGRMKFRDFYLKNKDKIQREEDGSISLPILVNEGKIYQGVEKIINNRERFCNCQITLK